MAANQLFCFWHDLNVESEVVFIAFDYTCSDRHGFSLMSKKQIMKVMRSLFGFLHTEKNFENEIKE